MPRIVIVFLVIIATALVGTIVTFIVLRNQSAPSTPETPEVTTENARVFFSDDGGAHWRAVAGSQAIVPRLGVFKSGGSGQLYIGTERTGLFIAQSGSDAVQHVRDPSGVLPDDARITALAQSGDGTKLYVAATHENRARVVRLTENAAEEIFRASLDRFDVTGLMVNPGNEAHITIAVADGTVFETRDGGRSHSWEPTSRIGTGVVKLWQDEEPEGTFWAVDSKGDLFQSDSRGRLWKELPRPVLDDVRVSQIYNLVFHSMRRALLAATDYGLGESRDQGNAWALLRTPVPAGAAPITAIAAHPHFGEVFWMASGHQVYRTDDGGISWRQSLIPEKKTISFLLVDPAQPKHLYAGTPQ